MTKRKILEFSMIFLECCTFGTLGTILVMRNYIKHQVILILVSITLAIMGILEIITLLYMERKENE